MRKARARVGATLEIADLGPAEIERLRRDLSFPNPEYVRAIRMNRKAAVPDRVDCLREKSNGNIIVPRGSIAQVRAILKPRDFELDIIRDERVAAPAVFPRPLPDNRQPRDYQREAVTRARAHTQGVVTFPCGTGKTTTGIAIAHDLQQRTLVLVHTDDLLEQWIIDVREMLGVEPGVVRGGEAVHWADITIASVHKLRNMIANGTVFGELSTFGLLIIDEAHHTPAETFTTVIEHIPAKFRIGLTATPDREDGMTPLVYWTIGEELSSRTVQEMVKAGWLTMPRGFAVHTGLEYEYTGGRPDKKTEAVARAVYTSKERNALVAKQAKDCFDRGLVTLVLTSRKSHLDKLAVAIAAETEQEPVALGGHSKRPLRLETLDRMRGGDPIVVVAMPIFDEGVNVPALGAILLAFPESAEGRTMQRVGRLMRPYKGATPELYDFVDDKVEMLSNRWDERRSIFKNKIGIEMTHVGVGHEQAETS